MKHFKSNLEPIHLSLIFSALLLIYIPLFTSDYGFYDDIQRGAYYYIGLANQGRLVPAFFYRFFYGDFNGLKGFAETGKTMYILSFFATLLTCIFTANSSRLISYPSAMRVMIACTLFTSPFLLGNVIYHVDAFFMLAGLSLSIVAFFYNEKKSAHWPLVFLILASLFYQPSIYIYLTLSIGYYCISIIEKKPKLPVKEACYFIITLLFIKILISFILKNEYLGEQTKIVSSYSELKSNIFILWKYITENISFTSKLSIIVLCLLTLASTVRSLWQGNFRATYIIPLILVQITLTAGIAVIMSNTLITARVMMGFSGFLLTITILSLKLNLKVVSFIVSGLFCINLLNFSMSVSAFNSANQSISISDKDDLNKLNLIAGTYATSHDIKNYKIVILNQKKMIRSVNAQSSVFPLIGSLIKTSFNDFDHGNHLGAFSAFYSIADGRFVVRKDESSWQKAKKIFADNALEIRLINDNFYVKFSDNYYSG